MNKKIYLLAFSFALSLVLHMYLTPKFYQMNYAGGVDSKSMCNINATFNCDEVTVSPYASFLSIPLSVWGFALNFILFAMLIGYLLSDDRKASWALGLKVLTTLSAVGSLVMLVISLTLVQAKCLFCFTLHFIAFAQVFVAYKLDQNPESSKLSNFFNFKKTPNALYLMLAAIPLVAFIGHTRMLSKYTGPRFEAQTKALIESWKIAPAQPLLQTAKPILEKNMAPEGSFEIIEFADFLCSHCKHASSVFKSFLNNYKANYKLMVMPLDQTCKTPEDTTGPSCLLAKGVYCATQQDKGWQAHDWVFERQSDLMKPVDVIKQRMSDMAQDIKIASKENFSTCLEEEATHKAIVDSRKLAEELKITGTPAIFVNGKSLPGGQMLQVLKRAYDLSLSVDK